MILDIFLNLIIFIITLGILILVHEYGHFLAARFFKVKIEQFSIGFGPVLWTWIGTDGTKYVISAFLIGGYVKLFDITNTENNINYVLENSFYPKKIWKRSIIVVTGPIFNFIFSILLYTIVFIVGIPVYKPVINYILPNSIIERSGMPIGSEIKLINNVQVNSWEEVRLKILHNFDKKNITITTSLIENKIINYKKYVIYLPNNWFNQSLIVTTDPIIALGIFPNFLFVKSTLTHEKYFFFDKINSLQIGDKILLINAKPIYNWESFVYMIKNSSEKTFNMLIERNKSLLYLNCSLHKPIFIKTEDRHKHINLLLNTFTIINTQHPKINSNGFFKAIAMACCKTGEFICFIVSMLMQLFSGDIKITNLHGPIAIAKGAGQSVHAGIIYYLMFLAVVSINLGIVNLLPLPILDGGQLLFLLLEKIKGESISQKTQSFVYIISFVILIFLAFLTLYNDIIEW